MVQDLMQGIAETGGSLDRISGMPGGWIGAERQSHTEDDMGHEPTSRRNGRHTEIGMTAGGTMY